MGFLWTWPVGFSPDAVLALALIHHLAIANNLPLSRLAGFFGELCRSLIIEFVPTRFRFSLLTHLHLHAKAQTHYADKPVRQIRRPMSRRALLGLIENFHLATASLLNPGSWGR